MISLPGIAAREKALHARKYNVAHWYNMADLEQTLKQVGFVVTESAYLLKTPLSAALYRAARKSPKLSYLLFPFSYPASLLSERFSSVSSGGYKLAVSARAV